MVTTTQWHATPTSVKAVVVRDGQVLLCHNPRGNWELPGGRPDADDDSLADTLVRELHEETGLKVEVGALLLAELFRPVPTASLAVIVFRATVVGGGEPVTSAEHLEVCFFAPDALPAQVPDVYRRAIALAVYRTV
jgi:8-oxo-dGTP diphosphatase